MFPPFIFIWSRLSLPSCYLLSICLVFFFCFLFLSCLLRLMECFSVSLHFIWWIFSYSPFLYLFFKTVSLGLTVRIPNSLVNILPLHTSRFTPDTSGFLLHPFFLFHTSHLTLYTLLRISCFANVTAVSLHLHTPSFVLWSYILFLQML